MNNWFRKLPQSLVQSGKKHKGLKYPILLLLLLMAAVCRGIDAVGTLARPTMRRRVMAAALTVCMVFTMMPIQTFAAEARQSGGLCEHHPVHTEECGYSEGTDGSPCTHEHKVNGGEADREGGLGHTEDCYKEVTKCVHEHTAECYPDDNSVSDNDATPSDATEKEPTECTHFCSEETGCVTEVLDCPHEHDDACGYVEAVADTPCGYTCDLCAAQDNGNSGQNVQPPVCDCDEPCVEGDMNTACPVCGAEGAVPSDCGALPTLLNAPMPAGTPITGDGYSFDPDSCELTISSDDGTTAWRSDSQISTDNQYPNVLSVVLADTVTAIGDNAFSNCTNLTSIQLPDTLTSIGNRAFSYCSQDGEISLDLSGCTDLTSIGEYAFYCFDGLTNIQLPNTLTSIGNRAFSECRKLTSLDMSGCTDPTSIETNAFNNCTKLETINLPNSLSSLGEMAFYGCLALTSLDLSGCTGLTSIGRKTFYSCRGLESVKLPSTLASIGNEVFDSCALLAEVTFTGKNAPTLGLYVFSGTSASLKIIVPADGTGYTGTTASTNWKALADKIQQPSEDDANNDGYHDGDVVAINAIIENNGLSATKDGPVTWDFATWSSTSPKRITELDLRNKSLTGTLDVSGLTSLTRLNFNKNQLTALNVSDLTNLGTLDCSSNQLTELDVSSLTSLTHLVCNNNQLTALDVSGLTSLIRLECIVNKLTTLNVSDLTSLTQLYCNSNPLTSLKLSDTLSLTVPATTGGTVECTSYTHSSKSVELQATADTDYTFEKWTASGTTLTDDTSNPVTFTLDWNITVTPVYSGGIPAPTVTSVEITPKTASVQKGMTQQFGAAVTGTDSPAQTVTWTVTGGKAGTSISTGGLLTVASDETAATLTVTATSTVDTTKSGTATVAVTSTPVTKYILTVTNGTGGGSYEAGAVVSITAGPAPQGQIFDKWISADGVSFGNAASATTTITMPAKAVTVAATYKDSPVAVSHTITASAGTGGSISPSGTVNVNDGANQTFTITANSNYSISSVTVDGVNQGGISTYTFSGVTANHTISATFSYNGGGSSGGGSGSGGSSSSGSQTDKPSQSMTGSTTTNVTVDGSGNANVTVTNQNVNDAIAAAKAEAQKQGVNVKDVSVVINVATDKAAAQITANLPKTVQDSLISNNVGSVEIKSDTVTMRFSQTAIQQMNSQAQADVTITAAKADNSKLTGEAKTLIGFRPMFNFTATYGDGKSITNFGTGSVYIAIPYTLGANEKAENVQVYYIDGGGVPHGQLSTYDTNRKAAVVVTSHYSTYAVGYKASAQAFGDIASHWAKSDIEYVTSRGLLNGTGKTTFSPDSTMTRGMFVTALGRLASINPNDYKTSSFTDVKVNAYYAPYVEWAAQKNIVSGTGDKLFSPDLEITREQMAVIMVNYAGKMGYSIASPHKAVTFADNASISEWAAKDVSIMQQAGVLMGRDGNRFDPQGAATRAEASAVLHRFVELVIDPVSAQGWTKNDSGHWLCYKDGKALTGWQTVDGLRYFFNADGVMHEGWKQDTTADKWYYWTTGGAAIGWKEIDGKWYYFNADGTMAGNTKVDGYEIGADGARKE